MFVASYSRTMSSARMKVEDEKPRLINILELRRQREREEAVATAKKLAATIEIQQERLRQANDAIRRANIALSKMTNHNHSADAIIRRICRVTGVSRAEIMSVRRSRNVVFARHAAVYWISRLTPKSLPEIGNLMGGRDHTTILHGRKAYVKARKAMGRTLRPAR
jgi:chromosomal replication initiation ATPase DnaA